MTSNIYYNRFLVINLVVVLLFVFCNIINGQSPRMLRKPGCNQSEVIRIDKTLARLLPFGPTGRSMPENATHLKRFCPESSNLTKIAENFFKKCYSKDLIQTSKLALYPAKKSIQQFCPKSGNHKTKRIEKLMKISACMNRDMKKNDTCARRFIGQLQTITLTVEEDKMKIPHLCCSAVRMLNCIEDMVDRAKCARENKELIMDFMSASSGDFFNIACGDYNEHTDKCTQLKPLDKSTLNKKATNSSNAKIKTGKLINYQTPVFLVMELFSTLSDGPQQKL